MQPVVLRDVLSPSHRRTFSLNLLAVQGVKSAAMKTTNYSTDTKYNSGKYETGFLFILPIIFVIILIGNTLLLFAIKSFRIHRVPDLLVGSLAGIDLLNDLGPVLMAIIVFQTEPDGFRGLQMEALCQFFNWMSSFLRLSASFIATLMALDCVCATLQPLYYRTKVTCVNVAKIIGCAVLSAAFISLWPAMGWGRVYPHRGLCSFDFGSSFALFIAILGYVQLVVVLTSLFAVSRKMKGYENRLSRLRRGRTLTFQNGRLQALELSVTRKTGITDVEENCTTKRSSHEIPRSSREITTLPEEDQSNRPRSPRKQRISRHMKESRQFMKILGSAVFLFYVSWFPIIVRMTIIDLLIS